MRAGAQGEHEHVVTERLTILGDHTVLCVHDAVESPTVPVSAELRRCVLQPEASPSLDLERLLRGHRAIDELQLGGQDRDVEAIRRERTQCQERLQPGDAAARDQHVSTARGSCSLFRQAAPQDLSEDYRVVVLGVMGGVDERQRAFPRASPERRRARGRWSAELLDVASAEVARSGWGRARTTVSGTCSAPAACPSRRAWPAGVRARAATAGRSARDTRLRVPRARMRASNGRPYVRTRRSGSRSYRLRSRSRW